ncbi:hypothetical protein B9J76_00435 [Lacticaseibacillus paracasei]|nr:hypothetical protein B9J76_00435 [Lacticaseibacillus paracasei]
MLALTITRSQSQKPPHKDHGCNGQKPTITAMVAYAPVSRRSCSRSQKKQPATGLVAYLSVIVMITDEFRCHS